MITNTASKAMVTDEVAVAEVGLSIGDRLYKGTGHAKKHPKDEPNDTIGLGLAYARALLEVVDELVHDTDRMIQEANARARARQDRIVADPATGEEFCWEDLARRFVKDERLMAPVLMLNGREVS